RADTVRARTQPHRGSDPRPGPPSQRRANLPVRPRHRHRRRAVDYVQRVTACSARPVRHPALHRLSTVRHSRHRQCNLVHLTSTRLLYSMDSQSIFSQISTNPEIQAELKDLYGNVNNIDLWVGGLAEDHAPSASVGPLFQRIIANQFERLRDGDRLWYQNMYSGPTLAALQHVTLAQIIARNTVDHDLQADVFFFKPQIEGTVFNDTDQDGVRQTGEAGVSGQTIELIQETGQDVAQTLTDANGHYLFNLFSGLGPGTYTVVEVLPSGPFQTKAPPAP